MPTPAKNDPVTVLEKILGEADALIRRRLKAAGHELPHLVVAVTQDGEVVLRSNDGERWGLCPVPMVPGRSRRHLLSAGAMVQPASIG